MSATFAPIFQPKFGSRFVLPETHPKLLEAQQAYITALFGRAPNAWWKYDEVSGDALDGSGGAKPLTQITTAFRDSSSLGMGDRSGCTIANGGPWQTALAGDLEVGLNDMIIAGFAEFRGNPDTLWSFGGKVASGPTNGWEILTFTDGRFQFDCWIAGAQKSANSGKDHRGNGPFPFFAGRVATRASNASFVYTNQGSLSTSGVSAAGDLTCASKLVAPGASVVATGGAVAIPWCALFIAADLSATYDARVSILAGMTA
jgi:hypothetical protein